MNKKYLLSMHATALMAAVVFGVPAQAAPPASSTKTATIAVSATVNNSCNLTTTPLAFGSYDPSTGTAVTSTATVTAICTKGTVYSIGLDTGLNGSAATSLGIGVTRAMSGSAGGTDLGYELYTSNSYSTVWKQTAPNEPAFTAGAGTTSGTAYTVFGSIPASQYGVTPGNFSDTVTATITY
jgi:spore coat protein U-like protein